ncbi:MAG TPA: transglycosylase domain-containing protein [Acidimicrobiales bacterium]|nr:transglycosylase domain-containing protein [Acidimicrobiales bacterium]
MSSRPRPQARTPRAGAGAGAPPRKRAAAQARRRAAPPGPRGRAAAGGGGGRRRRRRAGPGRLWRYRRLLFLLGFLLFVALAGFGYLLLQTPLPPATVQGETTFLTDANGNRLATFDNGHNRIPVNLNQVPQVVIRAVLDTEDHSYYSHGALDPIGIVRAAWSDISGHPLQGGSTIAQQYVKNVYVGSERTLLRKIKEAAIAVRLERTLSKNEILSRYLNTIYFGRGAYGVEAASQAYFGKDVSRLGLREAAYLAGLIRSPDTADATRNPAEADHRRDVTLVEMVRYHDLTVQEKDAVEAQSTASYVLNPHDEPPQVADTASGTQYFVDYVRRVLIAHFGLAAVEAGGMRVQTTLDLHTQDQAYQAVYGFLRPWEPAGALVAVDTSGDVKAMVGGRDFATSQVNLATGRQGGGSGRQPGSTFKPFLLAETIHEGYSVESAFPAPAQIKLPKANNGADYVVQNYEGEAFNGVINLVQATAESVNTVYAQLEQKIGVEKMANMAHQLGVSSPLAPNASLVLGTSNVSVLEMAGAYSTFADEGVRVDPHVITKVTTSDGRVLWDDQPARTRVLTRSEVAMVDYCLSQVVLHGTGTGAAMDNRQVAGKTGTTENYNDAWFIGYTPTLTAAVWMGYPGSDSQKMTNVRGQKVAGGTFPATIWKRFMTAALGGSDSGTFPPENNFGGRLLTGVAMYYHPSSSPSSGSSGTTGSTTGSGSGSSTTTTSRPGSGSGGTGSGTGTGGSTTTTTSGPGGSTTTTTSPSSSSTTSPTTTEPSSTTTTTKPESTTTTTRPKLGPPGSSP